MMSDEPWIWSLINSEFSKFKPGAIPTWIKSSGFFLRLCNGIIGFWCRKQTVPKECDYGRADCVGNLIYCLNMVILTLIHSLGTCHFRYPCAWVLYAISEEVIYLV